MSRLKNFFLEKTEGDGNCPFNAFILGFSRQSVIDKVEYGFLQAGEDPDISMRDFIQQAAGSLKIPSKWSTLKEELFQLRQKSKVALQTRIAPVLRDLAISLAERDSLHRQRTIEPLLSAFDDYVESYINKKSETTQATRYFVEDDIFKSHPFIQRKFVEIYSSNKNMQDAVSELEKWWLGSGSSESGYRKFLRAMKQDGVWAGDLELFQLARYFHVNLDVCRADYVHRIYSHSGKMPCHYLSDQQISQLVARQIINPPEAGDTEVYFLPLSEDEVKERINPVAEFDKVAWYIVENEFIKNLSIPKAWSACLKQLWLRNLIEKKGKDYVFIAERDEAMKLSAGIENSELIMRLWKKFHCSAPTVTLSNPEAVHWSNVLPVEEKPTENNIFDYYKSFMSYVYDSFFSPPVQPRSPEPKKPQYKFDPKFFSTTEATISVNPEYSKHLRNLEM